MKGRLKLFWSGFVYPFRGLRRLFHPRLRVFVCVPLLINAVLFAVAFWWLGGTLYDKTLQLIQERLPAWMQWVSWLVLPLLIILMMLALFYGFTLAANVLGAPFNGQLSARVETWLAPTGQPLIERPLWQEATVTLAGVVRTQCYCLARILPLMLLFLIPVVNFMAQPLWIATCAWMLALQYLDYPLGNHGLSFADQRRVAKQNYWLTIGFGGGVFLMTMVPGLNLLSMPSAIIGATLMTGEKKLLPAPMPAPIM